jgi:hypothetical protein
MLVGALPVGVLASGGDAAGVPPLVEERAEGCVAGFAGDIGAGAELGFDLVAAGDDVGGWLPRRRSGEALGALLPVAVSVTQFPPVRAVPDACHLATSTLDLFPHSDHHACPNWPTFRVIIRHGQARKVVYLLGIVALGVSEVQQLREI